MDAVYLILLPILLDVRELPERQKVERNESEEEEEEEEVGSVVCDAVKH